MDRYAVQTRTKELESRTQRLKAFVGRQAEISQNQKDVLLLETVACLTELTEITGEILGEQLQLMTQYGMQPDFADETEQDEMYMMCPHCHEALFLGQGAVLGLSPQCPHCHESL